MFLAQASNQRLSGKIFSKKQTEYKKICLYLQEFYQRNGLNLFFSSLEQERQYRNWDTEKDGPLETRLMFRDMILLKRPSIR